MSTQAHFRNLNGTELSLNWHERSEHWSVKVSEDESISIQCYVVDLEVYDDHATLFCWTEQGDMSLCMNIPKGQAFALDRYLRQRAGHYDGLVVVN